MLRWWFYGDVKKLHRTSVKCWTAQQSFNRLIAEFVVFSLHCEGRGILVTQNCSFIAQKQQKLYDDWGIVSIGWKFRKQITIIDYNANCNWYFLQGLLGCVSLNSGLNQHYLLPMPTCNLLPIGNAKINSHKDIQSSYLRTNTRTTAKQCTFLVIRVLELTLTLL